MCLVYSRGETKSKGNLQCTKYIPKWYDGLTSIETTRCLRELMHRVGMLTEDNMPQTPTDVQFCVYSSCSVSDIVEGTLVFKLYAKDSDTAFFTYSMETEPINRARLDYIARLVFDGILNTCYITEEKAVSELNTMLKNAA